ncbi:Hypothetical predicted protein [Pelobates cultripes]|uniref:Uncharacterized protein n=1 Tax=Pelobates cultripes TaxID=61616 RepID=A0AAD1SVY2_PELCU|nr:Hypothetical predicted protein [Pelobates cultripes]
MFKKNKKQGDGAIIPGWEDEPYASIARELACSAGKCDSECEKSEIEMPTNLLACLKKIPKDKLQKRSCESAIKVTKAKGKVGICRISKRKMQVCLAQAGFDWDPETWDGNIWSSDEESEGVNALPVVRRKLEYTDLGQVSRTSMEDYTQQEMADILSTFRQRSKEPLDEWVVRLAETGAGGINLDAIGSPKLATISEDENVRRMLLNGPPAIEGNPASLTLLELVQIGLKLRYPSVSDWPDNDKPWYGLANAVRKLKQEMVRQAIQNSQQLDRLMEMPVTVQMRNKIIKTAPPAYKQVIVTLLKNQTGNSLQLVTEAIMQLRESGDWAPRTQAPKNPGEGGLASPGPSTFRPSGTPKDTNNKSRVSRKEMFQALIREGVSKEHIDGKETPTLWRLYKQKGLHKKGVNVNSLRTDAPNPCGWREKAPSFPQAMEPPKLPTLIPTAPLLSGGGEVASLLGKVGDELDKIFKKLCVISKLLQELLERMAASEERKVSSLYPNLQKETASGEVLKTLKEYTHMELPNLGDLDLTDLEDSN